ncbi:MAG: hypothetical protein ACR2F8_02885 [Caulobacteraceae bacterium]
MKTGRDDLNELVRVSSIPADEPIFILRAQDVAAAATVRDWAARHFAERSSVSVIEQALRQADAMDKWPVKQPLNDGHLADHEAKQLVYAHGRREWNSGKIVAETHATALMAEIVRTLIDWGEAEGAAPPGVLALIAKAQELRATLDG